MKYFSHSPHLCVCTYIYIYIAARHHLYEELCHIRQQHLVDWTTGRTNLARPIVRTESAAYLSQSSLGPLPMIEDPAVRRRRLKLDVWKEWCNQWSQCEGNAITKSFFPSPCRLPVLNVTEQNQVFQLLTGHSRLNTFLFKTGQISSPRCSCAEEDETSEHFLFRCPLYTEERIPLRNVIIAQKLGYPPVHLHYLTQNRIAWAALIRYIKDTRRLSSSSAADMNYVN